MAFYKASGLKDPKSPHMGPSKGRKLFRDLNENRIGASIARQWGKIPLPSAVCTHFAWIWSCMILTAELWEYPSTVLGKSSIWWILWFFCDQCQMSAINFFFFFFAEFTLAVSVVSMWIALVPAHCCGSSSSSQVRRLVLFQHVVGPKKPLSHVMCGPSHLFLNHSNFRCAFMF